MADNDDALKILVDSMFTPQGCITDKDMADLAKERITDIKREYNEEGEISAATILMGASAVNAGLIPILEKWGPEVASKMLRAMAEKYDKMLEDTVGRPN